MAIAELPPISTEAEKPNQLNLEQMYLDRKAQIESGVPEAEIPAWEVFVRQEYRDSLTDEVTLDYIQRFNSDGEVQIIGTNLGKIEHSEYRAEDAFRHLRQSVVQLEEPTHYRFYTTDISVLNQDALKASDQADSLKKEFERLQSEGNIVFGPPLDEEALWKAVHGTPKVINLGAGEAFELDRQAAEKAREDQARAEAEALKLQAIEAAEYARELAEMEELRAAARLERENAEVGGQLAAVRAELAGALHAKLDKDQEDDLPALTTQERLLSNGFVMGAPEIDMEPEPAGEPEPIEPIIIPEAQPIPGQPTISWPHIVPTEITEGEDSPIDPEIPEGVRVITYTTASGKEQTRYQRNDGKFVGKDGLTFRERMGEEAYQAKKAAEAKRKDERDVKDKALVVAKNGHSNGNGHKNGNGVGHENGNGHGKGKDILKGTTVIARRAPDRKGRSPRAPKVEAGAPAEIPATIEHEIVNFREIVLQPDEFSIIYLDGSQLRDLSEVNKSNLEKMIKNLRVDADIPTLQELIKNMFGIDIRLVPPHTVPATA